MATTPPTPYVHQAYPQVVYDKNFHNNGVHKVVADAIEHAAAKKAGWLDSYKHAPGHNAPAEGEKPVAAAALPAAGEPAPEKAKAPKAAKPKAKKAAKPKKAKKGDNPPAA